MDTDKIVCPVDRTLNLFNKKWCIQIIRDMFFGKKHFREFKEDKPKLSNKVLSSCLKELEERSDAVVGWNPHCIVDAIETLVEGNDWEKPCASTEKP